ncbi:EAL domain-containing protein [Stutzerimonas nosocomialis]|nr:EAL domain-containing protein [Stutzerimonas nosocomialis]TLX55678.1 EAL domain-containing protein [Stutzerimonas nosocomialis]
MKELHRCTGCRDGEALDFPISMAFQPIVDITDRSVFAHEALVRGVAGEGAGWVLSRVTQENLYSFDQACRVTALNWSAQLQLPGRLSINFMPNAVYKPELCIRATLATAKRVNFPVERIMFEVTEQEQVEDMEHLLQILRSYRGMGFITAIDDFGAAYAGLNLLADFQPDVIKLDMHLIRGIDADSVRQVLVEATLQICRRLNITVIAEGIETLGEYTALREMGVTLFQGYLFAKPAFQALPPISFPAQ